MSNDSLNLMDRTLNDIELLKIGLFTHGMKVSENARKSIEGHEKRPLTLADYASTSGISLELEDNIWVNAPIVDYNPNFVSETPYILDFIGGDFFVRSPCLEVKVKPIPVSDYHNRTNVKGEKYTKLSENISSLSFSSNTASILNFKSGLFINQSCHKDLQAGRIQILVYLCLDFLYPFFILNSIFFGSNSTRTFEPAAKKGSSFLGIVTTLDFPKRIIFCSLCILGSMLF